MKKILTFIIIIAMTLSLGVPAFAATPATVTVASPTAAVNPGDTVDVAVTIADNPGMDVMKLKFSYDTAALTLKDIELGSVMGILTKNLDKAVALLEAAGTTNATGNGTLVTLKFEVKSTAAAGNYTIGFLVSDAVNRNEERVALTTQAGTVYCGAPSQHIPSDSMQTAAREQWQMSQAFPQAHIRSPQTASRHLPASSSRAGQPALRAR